MKPRVAVKAACGLAAVSLAVFGGVDTALAQWTRVPANDPQLVPPEQMLNPSGSRNLEPMEVKPQASALPAWVPPGAKAVIPEFK